MENEVNANIARLDKFTKEAKLGDFKSNSMPFEDERVWEILLLNRKKLEMFRDASDCQLRGTRYLYDEGGESLRDEDGKPKFVEIDFEEATDEELKNTIIRKFFAPGVVASMKLLKEYLKPIS